MARPVELGAGLTAHLEERMLMRGVAEVELRAMLESASDLRPARRRADGCFGRAMPETRGSW